MAQPKLRKIRLSAELENAFLGGLLYGAIPIEALRADELSVEGRAVYQSAFDLYTSGQAPPLPFHAVLMNMTEVYNLDKDRARAHLEAIKAAIPQAEGVEAVIRKLREKHALLSIANAAAGQLQSGAFDPTSLLEVLANTAVSSEPTPLSTALDKGIPPPPARLPIETLPVFTERVGGGLVGLTVISGEPAVGKSTLAWQAALDVGRNNPVLYYDLDNGLPTLLDRTHQMFGDDLDVLRNATKNIYVRDSMRTLDSDLVYIPAPALVVVDIFQALPTPAEYERQGLGHWIHRLGALRRRGYHVLVVSEVQRAMYGQVGLGAFKGTGEIEYTADLAIQMVPTNTGAAAHIVKNRHGERKGLAVTLQREKGFWWKEITEAEWGDNPWASRLKF